MPVKVEPIPALPGLSPVGDADRLRRDPMFKLAMGRLPGDGDLCSQPTTPRFESLPDARALLRMGGAMADPYCQSFRQVPRRIVLDIDDTFDAVHGGQQLRLFNAHRDEYGFLAGAALRFAAVPSWCSTARAAWSPPCRARPAGRQASRSNREVCP